MMCGISVNKSEKKRLKHDLEIAKKRKIHHSNYDYF